MPELPDSSINVSKFNRKNSRLKVANVLAENGMPENGSRFIDFHTGGESIQETQNFGVEISIITAMIEEELN